MGLPQDLYHWNDWTDSQREEIANRIDQIIDENERHRNEMQDYIALANIVDGYIGMKHTHPLYKSITQDLLGIIAKLKRR